MSSLVAIAARLPTITKLVIVAGAFGLFWSIIVVPQAQKEIQTNGNRPVSEPKFTPRLANAVPPKPDETRNPQGQMVAGAVTRQPRPQGETVAKAQPAESVNRLTAIPKMPETNQAKPKLATEGEGQGVPSNSLRKLRLSPADEANLDRCLSGHYPCNREALSGDQRQQADTMEIARNLSRCLNGYLPCERQKLSTSELDRVDQNEKQRNVFRCVNGYVPCNRGLLSREQQAQVSANDLQRNLSRCLSGYVPCDSTTLTSEQLAQVRTSEISRNSFRCLNGWVPCNRELLTPEQQDKMRVNDFARNLSRCLNGSPMCDKGMLSSTDLARVKANEKQRNYSRCLSGSFMCVSDHLKT